MPGDVGIWDLVWGFSVLAVVVFIGLLSLLWYRPY